MISTFNNSAGAASQNAERPKLALFRISLGFKQLAHGLHVAFGMTGVAAALLAAIAIIGISLCLESSHWVGVDFGRV
jgi:hypothetical protein